MSVEQRIYSARDKNDTNTGRLAPERRSSRGGSNNFIRPERSSTTVSPQERGRGGSRPLTSNKTRS